ncbi:7149_t:CDS:1, partial [Gigaspora margarita]
SKSQRMRAQDLLCVFENLVKKYKEIGLKFCKTKETQRWQHASTQEAARQLTFYFPYFIELTNLHSLRVYSLCERHYNQLIVSNNLYNLLQGSTKVRNRTQSDDNQNDLTDSNIVLSAAFSEAINYLYLSFISTQ